VKHKLWRRSVAEEVDTELAFHFEMSIHELMEKGMTRQQARAEAERRFGDVASVNADCRRFGTERDQKARRAEYWTELRQDMTFAVRQLAKARAFAAVAILTLALGIGATAAVFSALDAVVLRALPFDDVDRIVEILPSRRGEASSPAAPEFAAMRDSRIFEYVSAAVLEFGVTMKLSDLPEIMGGARVSVDYFNVFGARPFLGRTFTADEDVPGHAKVVVLSHRTWVNRFNSDRGIVGKTVQLDGLPHTIIGVASPALDFSRNVPELFIPLALSGEQLTKYNERFLTMFARLRPNMTIEQAQAAATAAERAMAERIPDRVGPVSEWGAEIQLYADRVVGDYGSLLLILLGAVGFVLLIACSNVANLLLARGAARSKELAIRVALGAGRGRLTRQLLTESFVLALVGAVLGLGVAFGLQRVILSVSPESIPRLEQATISWRVLAFTLGLAVVSCVLFGLLPALRAVGPQLQGTLREGGRQSGIARDRLRHILVAAEVALAITLLIGSGLLIRSAWLMQRVNPGFEPKGVFTARLVLPASRYSDAGAVTRLYKSLRDAAAQIPGVKSAALVSVVPLSGSSASSSVLAEGQSRDGNRPTAGFRLTSSEYFSTMGIKLLAGRDISRRDDASAPPVIVVSEALVKLLWPGLTPREVVGKRMDALSGSRAQPHFMEVVGVVADLHDEGLARPPRPAFYAPFEQAPAILWPLIQRSLVVVLRSTNPGADPATLEKPLARTITQLDASLPIADSRTMMSFLEGSLETARMNTLLLSLLGSIALVLAIVGIYGVVSYFVSQRTHEIGVRMALGATPALIWRYVVRRGLTPIVIGLAIGLALSTLTTSAIKGQLYQVTGHDPATLVSVAVLLFLVGLLATYVPARRAMRVPPVVALNEG
jgi:putative ABC transport system permease protein